MKRVQLIGRVVDDPTVGTSGRGIFARFSIAASDLRSEHALDLFTSQAEWHQLVCYDGLAMVARETLTQGCWVYVEGRPLMVKGRWTAGMGGPKKEIRLNELCLLSTVCDARPVLIAARAIASIELLLRRGFRNGRSEVHPAELADMLSVIHSTLLRELNLSDAVAN